MSLLWGSKAWPGQGNMMRRERYVVPDPPWLRYIYTIYPGCSVIGNRCLHAAVEGWLQITAALQCGSCSNNSHLLQRFVNIDVRHQLELQEYHHRVKMETERVLDYIRRSGERPWAHVHMWPLVCSLLIIKPQLVGFMSGSKWCVATLAMMNVMWGKVWLGLGFNYLSVGGSQATRGRILQNKPHYTEHKVGGETLALVETIVLITYKS